MATVRRFIHGKPIFSPDRKHFHHMLLKNGYSHRNAVFVLWAVAVTISFSAILLTLLPGTQSLSLLIIFMLLAVIFIFKLGYFRYYDRSGLIPWVKSIIDEAGISRDRRRFFDLQIQINEANNLEELWCCVEQALLRLEFINCAVYLNSNKLSLVRPKRRTDNRRRAPALFSTIMSRKKPSDWSWVNPAMKIDEHNRSLFRIEMDMNDEGGKKLGTIVLVKDQTVSPVSEYTLKRIENLRRSITKALSRIHHQPAMAPQKEPVFSSHNINAEVYHPKPMRQIQEVTPVQLSIVANTAKSQKKVHGE